MTTPFWCVFLVFLLVWAARAPALFTQADKAEPTGLIKRAIAAHHGLQTSFAPFAAAVLIAHSVGADARRTAVLALAFAVAQLAYLGAHLADVEYLRMFVWLVSFLTTVGLFALAATS